jgi:hypothetical protein
MYNLKEWHKIRELLNVFHLAQFPMNTAWGFSQSGTAATPKAVFQFLVLSVPYYCTLLT